jgi:hypothetical protein
VIRPDDIHVTGGNERRAIYRDDRMVSFKGISATGSGGRDPQAHMKAKINTARTARDTNRAMVFIMQRFALLPRKSYGVF